MITVQTVLVTLAISVVLGWTTTRLLGVRPVLWRWLVAGVGGWLIGVGVVVELERADIHEPQVATVVMVAVIASMVLSIALDVILHPRRVPHRRPPLSSLVHPVAAAKRRLAVTGRLREVAGHARARKLTKLRIISASSLESPEVAYRLRLFLEDCGGMFVKVGQIASTRADVLPPAIVASFSELRQSARPVEADEIRAVIESELDRPVAEVFATFEWEPMAAASIGQTHRATLLDGTEVVVKVQRPGVDDVVERDAAVLRWAAGVVDRRVPAASRAGIVPITDELIAGLEEELDYTHEAAGAGALGRATEGNTDVRVPFIRSDASTSRVLVMQEVHGTSVGELDGAADLPVARDEIARRLLSSFLDQVVRAGSYHADPHPGNILVDAEGTIWLIDFGAVGYLDRATLESFQMMVLGVTMGEVSLLARSVVRLAGTPGSVDRESLEADLGALLAAQACAGGFDPRSLADIIGVMRRHDLVPPPTLTTLSRALITLEGTLRVLDPAFDLAHETIALIDTQATVGEVDVRSRLQRELIRSLPALRTLPEHLETIATQLEAGRLTLQVRHFGDDQEVIDTWLDRLLFTLVGCAGLIGSALLVLAAGTAETGVAIVIRTVGFVGLFLASTMVMRITARVLRRHPD